jgi:hypothetical protein
MRFPIRSTHATRSMISSSSETVLSVWTASSMALPRMVGRRTPIVACKPSSVRKDSIFYKTYMCKGIFVIATVRRPWWVIGVDLGNIRSLPPLNKNAKQSTLVGVIGYVG